MPAVRVTPHLSRFFPKLADWPPDGLLLDATSVRDLLTILQEKYPGLAGYLLDDTRALRPHVQIYVNDEPIYDRRSLSDALAPDDRVYIAQALSGG